MHRDGDGRCGWPDIDGRHHRQIIRVCNHGIGLLRSTVGQLHSGHKFLRPRQKSCGCNGPHGPPLALLDPAGVGGRKAHAARGPPTVAQLHYIRYPGDLLADPAQEPEARQLFPDLNKCSSTRHHFAVLRSCVQPKHGGVLVEAMLRLQVRVRELRNVHKPDIVLPNALVVPNLELTKLTGPIPIHRTLRLGNGAALCGFREAVRGLNSRR
mmetsp:Transcript_6096/g.11367  ORF Transcript_6096/g.11367 Transcript_6096/m.11367 type:complete len:211 (+) Transcript_6096:600-1232(+)